MGMAAGAEPAAPGAPAAPAAPPTIAPSGIPIPQAPTLDLSGIPVPMMPAPDPMMKALMDQNAAALQSELQRQARMDTSSILARYGSQLAIANRAA